MPNFNFDALFESLSRRFERFGLVECKGSSPLYERLSLSIAADPEVLAQVPADSAPLVFHTFTLNQFAQAAREHFTALLSELAIKRELFRVSIEWMGTEQPEVRLARYAGGEADERLLAHCHPHGEWLEWLRVPGSR